MTDLSQQRCIPCEGGVKPLSADEATEKLKQLGDNWELVDDGKAIRATFKFKGFMRTVMFVNSVAWIAQTQDHHPDVAFDYNTATVKYWTHAIDGLSDNDFICAAKVDALLA